MSKTRDNYWSMLKGIAILAVLMIHIPLTTNTNSLLATRQIINFPVAMFLFLSGLFVKRDENIWVSTKRLLFPYLIWSSFWCIITPPQSIKILLLNFVTGGYSILYFLFVLIQLKLLTPYLIKRVAKEGYRPFRDWLWLVSPLYLLAFTIIRLLYSDGFERVNQVVAFDNFFPSWIVYYYLGIFCRNHGIKIRASYLAVSTMAAIIISILAAFWLCDNSSIYNFPFTQSKLTSLLLALSVILLFYSLHEKDFPNNVLAHLGEMSFGIYILHLPVKFFLQKIISLTHSSDLLYVYQLPLVLYLSVLVITFLILLVVYRIVPRKYVRLLGLQ